MSEPSAVRVFFGRALMAVGGLVGGLSGLCTGLAFALSLGSLPTNRNYISDLEVPFHIGGVPLGLGLAIFLVGRAIAVAPIRRWVVWTALVTGLLIVAGTLHPALSVLIHGPRRNPADEFGLDPLSDPLAPLPLLAGLVLAATAIYDLRRKPGRIRGDAFD